MRYPDLLGHISQEPALLLFLDVLYFLNFMRKVVGEGKEPVGTLQCSCKRRFGCQIAFREGDIVSVLQKFFRSRFTGIARQCTNLQSMPILLPARLGTS